MSEFEYDDLGRLVRMDGYSNAELEAMERQERKAEIDEDEEEESEESDAS